MTDFPTEDEYDGIPNEMVVYLRLFADKLKQLSEKWPSNIDAQATLILQVLQDDDPQTQEEFLGMEALFENSGNPEFVELPEGHTLRMRATRLARCITHALESAQAQRDAKDMVQGIRDEVQADAEAMALANNINPDDITDDMTMGNIGGVPIGIRDPERLRIRSTTPLVSAPDHICPRCGGDVPMEGRKGEYEGARSRTDHVTEVCSPCGTEEAWQEGDGSLAPQSAWPVIRGVAAPAYENIAQKWEEYRSSNRRAIAPPPLPRELPDLRLHLMEKWIPGGPYEKALAVRGMEDVKHGAYTERDSLKKASLWWIKDEMLKLTVAAANSIPDDVRGEEVEFPGLQDYGLAVFGSPWIGHDAMDQHPLEVNAIVWATTEIEGNDCISLSMYRYFDFAGGLGQRDLQEAIATGAIWDASQEAVGNQSADQRQMRLRGGSWVFMGRSDWPIKETLTGFEVIRAEIPGGQPFDETQMDSMIEDRRFFAAFCTLVNHKLTQTEMVWAPRVVRKRAEKAGVDSEKAPSHVRLIRLREIRKTHGDDEDREKRHIEWTHRWIVNGHMAWRRCGPKGQSRRLVFIAPFIKGPEDKELVIKENVRVWTR